MSAQAGAFVGQRAGKVRFEPKSTDAALCAKVGFSGCGQKPAKIKLGFSKGFWYKIS